MSVDEPWRELRVGDRIRIVRLPGEDLLGYTLHLETKDLYERLIAMRKVLRIYEIDKDGLPWIKCRVKADGGGWEYHYLAVNDDSWELVSRISRDNRP
jgi:hypothetical protein